jgi:hypothetical protein
MVDRGYLLHQPPPPPAWKRLLDQAVVPAIIDAAALLEAGAEQVARRARVRPLLAAALMLGLGWSAGRIAPRRS